MSYNDDEEKRPVILARAEGIVINFKSLREDTRTPSFVVKLLDAIAKKTYFSPGLYFRDLAPTDLRTIIGLDNQFCEEMMISLNSGSQKSPREFSDAGQEFCLLCQLLYLGQGSEVTLRTEDVMKRTLKISTLLRLEAMIREGLPLELNHRGLMLEPENTPEGKEPAEELSKLWVVRAKEGSASRFNKDHLDFISELNSHYVKGAIPPAKGVTTVFKEWASDWLKYSKVLFGKNGMEIIRPADERYAQLEVKKAPRGGSKEGPKENKGDKIKALIRKLEDEEAARAKENNASNPSSPPSLLPPSRLSRGDRFKRW